MLHHEPLPIKQIMGTRIMQRKLFISGDYDSCFDILFEETWLTHDNLKEGTDADLSTQAEIARDELEEFLINKTRNRTVGLYVGSNRQSEFLNASFAKHHKNGDCFENYAQLCEEQNWTFCKLLLADVQNNQPSGSAMQDISLHANVTATSKLAIIQAQIADIAKNHPNEKVDFCFFDDDTYNAFMPEIAAHYNDNLPEHINSLTLVRYDWFERAANNNPSIMKITRIEQPKWNQLTLTNTKLGNGLITIEASKKRKLNSSEFFTKPGAPAKKCKHENSNATPCIGESIQVK